MRGLALCIAPLLAAWSTCLAQSTAGRISGSVQDSSAAVIPGAEVAVVNVETGQKVGSATNGAGQFVLYPLSAGTYKLTAQKTGFRDLSIDGIRLEVNDSLVHNLTLEVGAAAQEVTVSASAVPIINQTPSVEGTITEQQTADLPLNGRSFDDLVLLTPGAVDNRLAGAGNDPGPYAVNGNRSYGNNFLVDGISNTNVFQPQAAATISIDAIREFKVISGVPPAEYGQGAAAVNVVTRGGTNRYRGNVYEYFRGTTLQARDPFSTVGTQPYREHHAGGTIGGPVRLPRYDGRNRTFFFFNYEAGRLSSNVTRVASIPLDAFWKGDFSALLSRNIQLRDPLGANRPIIPGNRLDQYLGGSRISSTAVKFQPLYGSPNLPGYANNSVRFREETNNNNQFTARLDQQLPANQSVSARFVFLDANLKQPWGLGSPGPTSTQYTGARNLMVNWTAPAGTRAVNEFKLGYTDSTVVGAYQNNGTPTVDSLGLQGFLNRDQPTIPYLPQLNFQGNDTFSTTNYGPIAGFGNGIRNFNEKLVTISEAFSWSPGRHQFKFGFQAFRSKFDALNVLQMRGQVNFNSGSANSSGYSFADFLMGLPATGSQSSGRPSEVLSQLQYSFFAQDDWRIGRRLTLSMGVREEVYRSPVEERDRISLFSPAIGGMVVACRDGKLPVNEFPARVVGAFAPNGTWPFPLVCGADAGYNPRGLLPNHNGNWAPRLGIAWDPSATGRFSIRGGYGITYTRYPLLNYITANSNNPPFSGSFTYAQRLTNNVPALTLDAPFAVAGSNSVSVTGISPTFGMPVNQQWNVTLEQALTQHTLISLAYLGNKGNDLYRQIDVNGARLDSTGKVVRAYSDKFGVLAIPYRVSDGNSIYHAMKLEFRRRFTRGLGLQGNWTWGRGIDDVGLQIQTTMIDVENLGRDRAVSDYSRNHIVAANGTWDLPYGKGRRFGRTSPRWLDIVTGGWSLNGIYQWTTGRRGTPSTVSSNGLNNTRPDVVGNPNLPVGERRPELWFDTTAFRPATTDPATGLPRFGNAGRNIIIFPGIFVVNGNLAKSIPLGGEQRRLVLRVEGFNVLNHPNWNNPSANISANNAGRISSLGKAMRQTQFAVRYEF
jgi:hypothetical protein